MTEKTNPPDTCTPEMCARCSDCICDTIDTITIKIEWQHKRNTDGPFCNISDTMADLQKELEYSGIKVIYLDNCIDNNLPEGFGKLLINGYPLGELLSEAGEKDSITPDIIRKCIFQALLLDK